MSDEIRPALTPEKWADAFRAAGEHRSVRAYDAVFYDSSQPNEEASPTECHEMAALALHGQPFGFTWVDVDLLRAVADQLPTLGAGPNGEDIADADLTNFADRIAALLPPRAEA